jgi:hypothetical protein
LVIHGREITIHGMREVETGKQMRSQGHMTTTTTTRRRRIAHTRDKAWLLRGMGREIDLRASIALVR